MNMMGDLRLHQVREKSTLAGKRPCVHRSRKRDYYEQYRGWEIWTRGQYGKCSLGSGVAYLDAMVTGAA